LTENVFDKRYFWEKIGQITLKTNSFRSGHKVFSVVAKDTGIASKLSASVELAARMGPLLILFRSNGLQPNVFSAKGRSVKKNR
jgi:hypothetical protein